MQSTQPVVELFDLFLEEVSLTYGDKVAEICREKLSRTTSTDDVDEMAILDAAKQEAGFRPDLSSLSAASLHFCS